MTSTPALVDHRVSETESSPRDDAFRVLRALSNRKWDFRTIGGIARETKLSREQVERILAEYPELFRPSRLTHNGESLYTVRGKPETLRERLAELRDFIASPVTYRQ